MRGHRRVAVGAEDHSGARQVIRDSVYGRCIGTVLASGEQQIRGGRARPSLWGILADDILSGEVQDAAELPEDPMDGGVVDLPQADAQIAHSASRFVEKGVPWERRPSRYLSRLAAAFAAFFAFFSLVVSFALLDF